ncbi:tetratricopeptide repeat-containing sensor histidine kinase [Flavobacterium ardleyense]|uniref:tetratricopeptide repeat-containing sensor histidine kinase n=1 Tax=Flavobacterium ardleyense TaxID=2038737 RepID=UPI00298C75F0|nr:ATP-binding protein [Flavobacterium ardleyense]
MQTSDSIKWSPKLISSLPIEQRKMFLDSVSKDLRERSPYIISPNQYLDIALEYYYINEYALSYSISKEALKYAQRSNDSLSMAKAFFYIGDSFQISQKDSAYYYYYQAEKIYLKNRDFSNVARMQFNKAYVLFYDGNYVACEVQVSKALQNLKNTKDYFLLYSCNSLLGSCLEKIGDFDAALNYHNNALQNIEKLDLTTSEKSIYRVSTVVNISNLYDQRQEYDKSIVNLKSILNERLKVNNPLSYARVLSNLAYSKFKNGEYLGVETMFLESIKIAKNLGNESDLLYKYIYFGEYYASQNDNLSAIKYINLANQIAVKNSNTNEILSTLRLLARIDQHNSQQYLTEYIKISDNSQALQKKTRNKYARIEYETTKIQAANKELSRNNIIIIMVAIILIILLVTFVIIRYIKYKNKELQFLRLQEKASEDVFKLLTEQQQKINQAKEVEKTKIAQELHDGVINTLYGIRLNLGFFNSKKDENAIEKRKDYIEELKKVEGEIRTISHELSRNTFFDTSDFNMLLQGLLQNQEGISTTRFSYIKMDGSNWNDVPNLYKINLYRIIQEAVLNVNKYAKAQNCIITFQRDNNIIRILIQDDGVGFDVKLKRSGIGHNNMNSRIKSLGGTIQITSELGKGTTIEIIIDNSAFQKNTNFRTGNTFIK